MDIVLGFQDVDRDIDRFMQKFGRPDNIDGTPVLRGYEEAKQFVVNAYFQKKAWDPLVAYYLGFNFIGDDSFILHLSDALRENRQHGRLKRLWNGVVTKRKLDFWHSYKYRNSVPSVAKGTLPKQKALLLPACAGITQFYLNSVIKSRLRESPRTFRFWNESNVIEAR